ncbi:MAG: hypothetical protein ABSH53_16750 [Holophaga sp.]
MTALLATTSGPRLPASRTAWPVAWLLALALASCRTPAPATGPRPAPGPTPGPTPAPAPAARPAPTAPAKSQLAPQFTFRTWSQALPLVKQGRVIETVTGHGGVSLILDDHTWVHLVAGPGEPLPRNPLDLVARNAPNAKAIKHSRE